MFGVGGGVTHMLQQQMVQSSSSEGVETKNSASSSSSTVPTGLKKASKGRTTTLIIACSVVALTLVNLQNNFTTTYFYNNSNDSNRIILETSTTKAVSTEATTATSSSMNMVNKTTSATAGARRGTDDGQHQSNKQPKQHEDHSATTVAGTILNLTTTTTPTHDSQKQQFDTDNVQHLSLNNHSSSYANNNNKSTTLLTQTSSLSSMNSVINNNITSIPEKMYTTMLDLTPEEILTIPVYKYVTRIKNETVTTGVANHNNGTTSPTPNSTNTTTSTPPNNTEKTITFTNATYTEKVLMSGGGLNWRNPKICPHPQMKPINHKRHTLIGRCCVGATSSGSHQNYSPSWESCNQNYTQYDRIRQLAIQELQNNPIILKPVTDNTADDDDANAGVRMDGNLSLMLQQCDICRIIYSIAKLNNHRRIAISGDSLQRQFFSAWECELNRRGFELSEWKQRDWPKAQTPPNRVAWKYGIHSQTCFNVTIPQEWTKMMMMESRVLFADTTSVEICHYDHYRPLWHMEQHKFVTSISDVMILNYGVHFLTSHNDQMTEYASSLHMFLSEFQTNITTYGNNGNGNGNGGGGCKLIFRETLAQHFTMHDSGEYTMRRKKEGGCVPHRQSEVLPYRRMVLYEEASKQNITIVQPNGQPFDDDDTSRNGTSSRYNVTLLPMYEFTSKLHDMHAHGGDCTHYCYNPYMWYPSWRHLRLTIDRLFSM